MKQDETPTRDEVEKLLERLNTTNKPKATDLARYRKALAETPGLWRAAGDLMEQNFMLITGDSNIVVAMREALRAGIEAQRRELGYENAGAMERALIDHVLLCKLRQDLVEYKYSKMQQGSMSLPVADYWERKVSATQKRYLRACEALAKIQKLMRKDPTLQVNIAAPGGQQVNIAGDLVRPIGEKPNEGDPGENK